MTEIQIASTDAAVSAVGRRTLLWRRFLRNKPAIAGVCVLVLLFVGSFVGPYLLPYDYQQLDYTALLQPPSAEHPFGTNQIGQDVLAQTLRGLQKSLIIGICVAIFSTAIAALVGALAGYVGGWPDRVIMWLVDLLLVVPSFIIIAVFTPRLKSSSSIALLILLLAVFGWMITARIVRGMTLTLREREFVKAAQYMDMPAWQIIARHIIPNMASLLIIDATIAVGGAILAETALSYFGFGIQPPDVSLGTLIASGTDSALTFGWLFDFPAGLLIVTVLAVNFFGDGLRDALDPTSGRARRQRAEELS